MFPDAIKECTGAVTADCQAQMDLLCDVTRSVGGWFEPTNAYNEEWWYGILGNLSGFFCILFFTILYFTEELQVHPMRIIMYIALFESIMTFALID